MFPAPWVKTGLFDLNGLYFFSPGKNEHILLGTNYHFNTIMGQKINAIGELFWGDHGVTFTWPDSIDTGQIISNTDDNRYYIFSSQYYMVLNQD